MADGAAEVWLTISRVANRHGVTPRALRYYEAKGLLDPVRKASGVRFYGRQAQARAELLVRLRSLGLSISEIRTIVCHDSGSRLQRIAVAEALDDRILRVRDQLSRLEQARRLLPES